MDNGIIFLYRSEFVKGDGEDCCQPGVGNPGASVRGEEGWRKHPELRHESGLPRRVSGTSQASKKSPKHVKFIMPVPETDTGGVVENTKGREITLSKELGKMTL